MKGFPIPFFVALTALLATGAGWAKARDQTRALSVGSPTNGRLEGGVELVSRTGLRLKRPSRARWGLPQLVSLIERGARRVADRHPGSVLLIGDLSRFGGGDLGNHHSHESGRDADIGFYFVDERGHPVELRAFQAVGDDGRARGPRRLIFDEARNWLLIQSFLTHPRVRVQHIFVAAPLRLRLLRHARQRGVSLPLLHRAALALKQPRDGMLHDDHYHVRIGCPPRQRDVCVAEPKVHTARAKVGKGRPRTRRAAKGVVGSAPHGKSWVARLR
jgi:penicillin-insensitive murein DD-endopeptidase